MRKKIIRWVVSVLLAVANGLIMGYVYKAPSWAIYAITVLFLQCMWIRDDIARLSDD